MNGKNLILTQKQNEQVKREPYYRKYGLISFFCGIVFFILAGVGFSKGSEVPSFGVLLISLFCFALATNSLFELLDIGNIKNKNVKQN